MRLRDISIQNVKKRKSRSILLVLTVIIGLTSVIFLQTTTEALKWDVANKIDEFGSNILILPDDGKAVTFGGITINSPNKLKELDMSMIPLMKTIENSETLATISPKLLDTEIINGKKVLLLGVQFPDELRLKKWWKIDPFQEEVPGTNELLVGSEAARALNISLNDSVQIKGEAFRVVGIIQPTGSPENDESIFMDLKTLQTLTQRPTSISLIEAAALCYTCPIEEVTRQLREKLPGAQVLALKSSIEARDDTVNKFNLFALSISVILTLVTILVITISLKSSIEERTKEIGILRAIGFRKSHIVQMILLEVVSLCILGGILGYGVGMGLAVEFGSAVANIDIQISWEPLLFLYSILASLIVAIIAGAYPSWKASKLDPSDALRYI